MKKSVLILVLLFEFFQINAQTKVALHSGNDVTIYSGASAFVDAYNAAVNGDLIYLPGGNNTAPALINKTLTIRGVGHYPQATAATNKTTIIGNVTIGGNADNLILEGIHVTGTLIFANNQKADFVTLLRNRFGAITYQGNNTTPSENHLIRECIIDGNFNGSNAQNINLSNNIIGGNIEHGSNFIVQNNLFIGNPLHAFVYFHNSTIKNNIFFHAYTSASYHLVHSNCVGNIIEKNIFRHTNIGAANSTLLDNYYTVDLINLFENLPTATFNYNQDYSLLAAAQTNYLGTDNTQVSIYGGQYPYKTNAVPRNPSITAKTIAGESNSDGQLPVQITVEAQNN